MLRLSSAQEAPIEASKWLSYQALLDSIEMEQLFDFLGDFFLVYCGTVIPKNQTVTPRDLFLDQYRIYVETLKSGQLPSLKSYQAKFSPVITAKTDTLFSIPIDAERQLIRPALPVIQLQAHHTDYSPLDQKFHSMVFGSGTIPWGIQFSYPQLYKNRTTQEIEQVRHIPDFLNNSLFHNLQKWLRQNTAPTRFSIQDKQSNVPIRLGKLCFSWINRHIQLNQKGIQVINPI